MSTENIWLQIDLFGKWPFKIAKSLFSDPSPQVAYVNELFDQRVIFFAQISFLNFWTTNYPVSHKKNKDGKKKYFKICKFV